MADRSETVKAVFVHHRCPSRELFMSDKTEQRTRVVDQFTRRSDAYAALVNRSGSPARGPLLDMIPLRATDRVLDVGCGSVLRDPSHSRALSTEELRALGSDLNLEELAVQLHTAELPIEAVLATSRPAHGMMERVRSLYARDAAAGTDIFGFNARIEDGEVWVTYPMTAVAWRR